MTPRLQAAYDKALDELQGKTLHDIQVDTAYAWCGRACAAAMLDQHDDAHEYAHEALEHAALSGSDPLLREVRAALSEYGVRF